MNNHEALSNLGVYVYGVAAIAAGIIIVVWGDFATGWQPIRPSPTTFLAAKYSRTSLLSG